MERENPIIQELKINLLLFQEEIKKQKKNLFLEKIFLFLEKEKMISFDDGDCGKENSIEILIEFLDRVIYYLEEIVIVIDNILFYLQKQEIIEAFFELKKFIKILEENATDEILFLKD